MELDISGPLNEAATVRGRAVISQNYAESNIDLYQDNDTLIYLTGEIDFSDQTTLTLGGSYSQSLTEGFMWGGLVMFDTNGDRINWDRDRSSSADFVYSDSESYQLFAELELEFSENLRVTARANYKDYTNDSRLNYLFGALDSTTGAGLATFIGPYGSTSTNTTFDLFADGKFSLFRRDHEFVIGASHSSREFKNEEYEVTGNFQPVTNFYEWNGSNYPEFSVDSSKVTTVFNDAEENRINQYASVRLNPSDQLKVILGSQLSWYEIDDTSNPDQDLDFDAEWLPFAGVLYNITDELTAYASYTSIHDTQDAQDESGNQIGAVEGNAYEVGLKYKFLDDRVLASAAYYYIQQDNLAQPTGGFVNGDPLRAASRGAEGATSNGIDLELTGQLTDDLQVQLSYNYNTIEDADGEELNTFLPEHNVKLFASYATPFLDGLTIGAGVNWQSSSYSESGDLRFTQDNYMVVDAFAKYQVNDRLSAQLNVNNLFDKTYANSYQAFGQYAYGAPINGTFSIKYSF